MQISRSNIKVDFKKSHDSVLIDKNTKKRYIDFMSMYSSLPIGYNHPVFLEIDYKEEMGEASQIKVCNCEYDSEQRDSFISDFQNFVNRDGDSNYDFFHFACTGALAVELALKAAIDYTGKGKIISFKKSFHGITAYGNFVTDRIGGTKSRLEGFVGQGFWPQIEKFEELEHLLKTDSDIAGVLIEPIRCTNGDLYFDEGFFERTFELCKKFGVLSIVDEIQTGFGSTGKVWYTSGSDILIFGKKSQVSGFMTSRTIGDRLDPKRYCVTWDGTLVDMVRCKYVIKAINDNKYLDDNRIVNIGEYIKNELNQIKGIYNVRGKGYILAFDLIDQKARDDFYKKALDNGLLTNLAGEVSIRLRPNLALSKHHAKEVIEIIKLIV